MNFIEYAWLENADIDAVIRDQVEHFLPLGQPFEWNVWGHDQPEDLSVYLAKHNFCPNDDPGSVMVFDLEHAPAVFQLPVHATIQRLTHPSQLKEVIQIEEEIWGGSFDWIHKRMGGHMKIPGYLSIYVAYCDGVPASTAWIYFHSNSLFASLFGGSTRAPFRGRGLYKSLLEARLLEAAQRGYRFVDIDSNANSRPIVERHGFRFLTTSLSYQFAA
jgi:hypothetical protein